jgi:hypothetical protein
MLSEDLRDRLVEFHNSCDDPKFRHQAQVDRHDTNEGDADIAIALLEFAFDSKDTNKNISELMQLLCGYVVAAPNRLNAIRHFSAALHVCCDEAIQIALAEQKQFGESKGGEVDGQM